MTFETWNILEMWHFIKWNVLKIWLSKYEMFHKRDVQNRKCFRNVTFKIWNVSKNVTLKIWSVSQTWCIQHEMFLKRDVWNMKICLRNMRCFKNVTFLKHCLDTTPFCYAESHFMSWTSRFWNNSDLERHVSETFHLLNFTFHCLNTWHPFVVPCHIFSMTLHQ